MLIEEKKALVRRQFEQLMNRGDLTVVDKDLAADFVDHEAPDRPRGAAAVKAWISEVRSAFPDIKVTIEDIVAEGDKVVVRNTWRGTHQGTFRGIPPTGRSIQVSGIVIWRIVDGKIAERWANIDQLGMMQQLGLIPAPDAKNV